MIIPPNYPNLAIGDRLVGRTIRIGLKVQNEEIVEQLLPPEADIIFGSGSPGVIAVPGWIGPDLCVIARGRLLTLTSGMSVIMCHETGEDRMEGSFDELSQAGVTFPLHVNVSRLNIRVRKGVVMLMEYMQHMDAPTTLGLATSTDDGATVRSDVEGRKNDET